MFQFFFGQKGHKLPVKRLTRKEIVQEDNIQAVLTGILQWSTKNKNLLLICVVVVLLGIAGSFVWRNYQSQRLKEFQGQFADALETYHSPVGEEEQDNTATPDSHKYHFQSDQERLEQALKKFIAVATDADSSEIGKFSGYYSALIKRELGQTEEAQQILESVLESAGLETRNLARSLLAELAEAENDHSQATVLLEEILDEELSSFPKEFVLLRLGRSHEALGQNEEALRFYRRITTEYPTSLYTETARAQIDQLEAEETSSDSVPEN